MRSTHFTLFSIKQFVCVIHVITNFLIKIREIWALIGGNVEDYVESPAFGLGGPLYEILFVSLINLAASLPYDSILFRGQCGNIGNIIGMDER